MCIRDRIWADKRIYHLRMEGNTMYRRVLPLLLTAVLLLSGCTAGQKNIPPKTDEKERTGQPLSLIHIYAGAISLNLSDGCISLRKTGKCVT